MKVGQSRGSPGLLVPLRNAWLPLYAILEGMEQLLLELGAESLLLGPVVWLLYRQHKGLIKRLDKCNQDHMEHKTMLMNILKEKL